MIFNDSCNDALQMLNTSVRIVELNTIIQLVNDRQIVARATCFPCALAFHSVLLNVWAGLLCLLQSILHEMRIQQALHQLPEAVYP